MTEKIVYHQLNPELVLELVLELVPLLVLVNATSVLVATALNVVSKLLMKTDFQECSLHL